MGTTTLTLNTPDDMEGFSGFHELGGNCFC
jgi:hypothetical protein